jgi:hypothetical protein
LVQGPLSQDWRHFLNVLILFLTIILMMDINPNDGYSVTVSDIEG